MNTARNILALDVGDARVGVALANTVARIPSPLAILQNDPQIFDKLKSLIIEQQIQIVVVGLPRNMEGNETGQSEASRQFAAQLESYIDVPIVFADESLSTHRAQQSKFMDKSRTDKHLDDIAACFILEEYFESNK